jgi:HEAT repeat protein
MTLDEALTELQSPDPRGHLRAIRWLRVLGGPRAVAALIGALQHPSADVQAQAARALGAMKALEAVPALIAQVQQSMPVADRVLRIEALAEIGDPRAVPALTAALRDPSARIVTDAAQALVSLGDPRATGPLLQALNHPDWSIRCAVAAALGKLQVMHERLSAAREQLAREMESEKNPQLREEMEREFLLLADNEVDDRPPSKEERWQELESGLAELADPEPETRRQGTRRVRAVGGPEAVSALIVALEDPEPRVRSMVALALGGLRAQEALPALLAHLRDDPSAHVRSMRAALLHNFADEAAFDALRKALTDPNDHVVQAATANLHARGDRRVIPSLLPLLEHANRGVRFFAARALLALEAADARLVAALEELGGDPEADEHDLDVAEWNCDVEQKRGRAALLGGPDPRPQMTMAELVEQARRLLAQAERNG